MKHRKLCPRMPRTTGFSNIVGSWNEIKETEPNWTIWHKNCPCYTYYSGSSSRSSCESVIKSRLGSSPDYYAVFQEVSLFFEQILVFIHRHMFHSREKRWLSFIKRIWLITKESGFIYMTGMVCCLPSPFKMKSEFANSSPFLLFIIIIHKVISASALCPTRNTWLVPSRTEVTVYVGLSSSKP